MKGMRLDLASGAGVALLSLLVVGFYFTGLACSDDTRYLMGAMRVALGEPISTQSLAERRAAFLLPGAAGFLLGGRADGLVVPYALLAACVPVASFALARQLLPRAAAAVAAVAVALQPVFFFYAGVVLPDLSAALALVLALSALVAWLRAVVPSSASAGGQWPLVLSGAALSLAFVLKESSLVFAPIVFAAVGCVAARRARGAAFRDGAGLAAGCLAVLLLEAVYFRAVAGHWYSSVLSLSSPHDVTAFLDQQGRGVLDRSRTLYAALGPYSSGLFALAAMSTCLLAWQAWRRRLAPVEAAVWSLLVACWLLPLVYFTYGTISLESWLPPVIQQRYFAPVLVPAAVLVGRLFAAAASLGRRHVRWGSGALLLVAIAGASSGVHELRRERGLAYLAEAKEAGLLAREHARRAYPRLPLHASDAAHTTDLLRCQVLLAARTPGGRDALVRDVRAGRDREGRFDYAALRRQQPPFLIVVHGGLAQMRRSPVASEVLGHARASGWRVESVARFRAAPRRYLHGHAWLPRPLAIEASLGDRELPVPRAADASPASELQATLVRVSKASGP